jgi:cupin 2 domain-containing protein
MSHPAQNVFAKRPQRIDHEDFLTLFETSSIKVERIISHSHSSPPGFWYDQNWDEWVIVMRGSATLEFEGNELVELKQGDYVTIAKHVKHGLRIRLGKPCGSPFTANEEKYRSRFKVSKSRFEAEIFSQNPKL